MSQPQALKKFGLKDLLRHNDVALALGVVMIVAMLMVPLPTFLLDVLLTLNIAFSVTMLLVTLYTQEALQYSTFPTILLVSTLFRLGLNVSSTRLILLHGHAGHVIESFGQFVVGGNYVVGILIFIILIIINFVVITNGAGRVSEVAARFTLDAMPGKQLSIDADLNAGVINEDQAKKRRQKIQREADFYGTMDGASKFVKGDAIAAIVIVIVNIVGGLIVGVAQQGLSVQDAASTFTVLTVGEGLVSQLPALLISVGTGILVTRVSAEDQSLGDEIGGQMFQNPKVIGILAALMLMLGVIPGMPNMQFLSIGAIAAFGSFYLNKTQKEVIRKKEQAEADQNKTALTQTASNSPDKVLDLLPVDPLALEIGYRLVPLIETDNGGDLLDRIAQVRKQIALDLGFVFPSVRVRDNLQLQPNQYVIKLRGTVLDTGTLYADKWLAMNTDADDHSSTQLSGINTKEPAFGLPAMWIDTHQKELADELGYTCVSASAVLSTHFSELLKRYSADMLSRHDVQDLLDTVKKINEPLLTDLVPEHLTVAEIQVILQQLLREKVCIRDMASILESLSYHYRVSKKIDYLSEQCRVALSRSICKQHANFETGDLPVLTLSPDLEDLMLQGLTDDNQLAMGPVFTQNLLSAINQELESVIAQTGVQPVLLVNTRIRLALRRLLERSLPQIAILAYNEVGPTTAVTAMGLVRMQPQLTGS